MTTGERIDPYLDFRFHVELDSLLVAGFSDVQGLEMEVETEEYKEGGRNHYTHSLPTRITFPNLTFQKGLTNSHELWTWVAESLHGPAQRRTGRIILLDQSGVEVRGWEFQNGYPVRWEGPDLSAEGSDVAIETLEIAHEGLRAFGVG